MIKSMEVKAFKSLYDVSIELGNVNVFIGENGSGKSNLLEAIGVLGAAASGRVDDEALIRRGVRPGVPALYKSSFSDTKARPSIRIGANAGNSEYVVELNNPINDPLPAWQFKNEVLKENGQELLGRSPASRKALDPEHGLAALKAVDFKRSSASSELLRLLSSYAIYSPNTSALRGLSPDSQQKSPVGLSGGGLASAVGEVIRLAKKNVTVNEILETARELTTWASSFESRQSSADLPLSPSVSRSREVLYFRDRYMRDSRNGLTGYDASEGALYLLFVAVLMALPSSPKLLSIDNFDTALNPRLARALMSHVCNWALEEYSQKQLLLTTHNPLVLDGLDLEDDRVRLFAVGRSRKGLTTISRIRLSQAELVRDGELWTVSRLWVMGHLGGVPDV
jgi:energy-coupling factor transporter ATP-binding protein EcfA2